MVDQCGVLNIGNKSGFYLAVSIISIFAVNIFFVEIVILTYVKYPSSQAKAQGGRVA